MADKKNEAGTQNVPEKNDPKRLVTVMIPLTREQQDDVFVCVNNHSFQIKRGVKVQVPYYIAEVLERSEESDQAAMLRQKMLQSRSLR